MGVLQPALHEVGRRWEQGEISVAQERLATGIAGRSPLTTATAGGAKASSAPAAAVGRLPFLRFG